MLRAAETSAALGAYREALSTLEAVRARAEGTDLARLLSLRADLLMAGADAGAVDAYRDALGLATDPADRSRLRARLARAATFAGDLETAAIALDGLVTDGSPQDTELLLARGTWRSSKATWRRPTRSRRRRADGWLSAGPTNGRCSN